MYYIYHSDKYNRLFVTEIRKANQIPIFSSPFLLDTIKRLPKYEKSFCFKQGSSDISEVEDDLYCLYYPKQGEYDIEL